MTTKPHKPSKPTVAWAAIGVQHGTLLLYTISSIKRDAVQRYIENVYQASREEALSRVRFAKVLITEVTK